MKKLSGIIAAAVCVTIGGVYATWTFADNNDIARIQTDITVGLTDIQTSGTAAGTYTFKDNTIAIVVDQKEVGNHTAVLGITGSITVVFTPNINAGEAVETGAIKTGFWVKTNIDETAWVYDDDSDASGALQIFDVSNTTQVIDGVGEAATNWTKQTDGTFEYVIKAETLAQLIAFKNEFKIESKAEHESFDTALSAGHFVLYVNDYATVQGDK